MTSSIMHSCDESDDSLRITSVEVEVEERKKVKFLYVEFKIWLAKYVNSDKNSINQLCCYYLPLSQDAVDFAN